MKNPFKKKGLTQTMISTLAGGAGNVAADFIIGQIDALSDVDANYINGGKIVAGALLGSMSTNKIVHYVADGMAVVGASALINSLISQTEKPASGFVANGTVGRVMAGDRYFKKTAAGKGFNATAFMGK